MSNYAEVKNGIVQRVIVADQDFIDTLENNEEWIETEENVWGGIYYYPQDENHAYRTDKHPDQSRAIRWNFAVTGGNYDKESDAFYEQQPWPNWYLDKNYIWRPHIWDLRYIKHREYFYNCKLCKIRKIFNNLFF